MIPNAKVTVTATATNITITVDTNAQSDYTIPSVAVGNVTVRVEESRFRPSVINNLTIDAATNVRAVVKLEVGTSTQAIEVQATAAQLQAEDSKASTTIVNKLDGLPLVVGGAVRSPFDLAAPTPEAKNTGGDAGSRLAAARPRAMAPRSTALA